MDSRLYFLKLLRWYINGEEGELEEGVDWAEIYELGKIHSVLAIVYLQAEKLGYRGECYAELKKAFLAAVKVAAMQDMGMAEVTAKLNAEGVDHMPVKGYPLRELYPDRETRSFGDVDFLIDESDRQACHKALLDIGFEYDAEHYLKNVWTYHKGILSLEVHDAIVYQRLYNDFDYIGFFKEKVKQKQLVEGHTYKLRDEDHLLYLLVHLSKHFYHVGVGVRMFLDIAVFINKLGDSLDFEYIKNELVKMKIEKFANAVFFICKKYLGARVQCDFVDQAVEKPVLDYVLSHGVFGFDNNNAKAIMFRMDGKKGAGLFLSRIFLDYETMVMQYEWFKNGKKFMLPYAWARRAVSMFGKKKRGELGNKFAALGSKSENIDKHREVLKLTGLKQ